MSTYCTEDDFLLEEDVDSFGFAQTVSGPLPVSMGGTGQSDSSRIRTNLSYNDGAYNSPFGGAQQIHVAGTLPIANGGTGATTAKDAENALINGLPVGDLIAPEDTDYYVSQQVGGNGSNSSDEDAQTYFRRPILSLWKNIEPKVDAKLNTQLNSMGKLFHGQILLPCSDGISVVYNSGVSQDTVYSVHQNIVAYNNAGQSATNYRHTLTGTVTKGSSTMPVPTGATAGWFVDLPDFVVGHVYYFGLELLSGAMSGTTGVNFYVMKQTSSTAASQKAVSVGSTWYCDSVPRCVCINFQGPGSGSSNPLGVYNNCVWYYYIIDMTIGGAVMSEYYHQLPKNPYEPGIIGYDRNGVPRTYPTLIEVISTTHAHCETPNKALGETGDGNLVKYATAGYEHVAISNYWPAMPWYPAEEFYTNVPTGLMVSPNAEQTHMTNALVRTLLPHMSGNEAYLHINGVGSFYTQQTTASPNEGGSVEDCIANIVSNLQYPHAGGATINHPIWSSMNTADICTLLDCCPGFFGMEIYNASCEWNNNLGKGYALDLWDTVLATGRQIYGLAVPDHWAENSSDGTDTNGFGYCHVLVRAKTEQQILLAYSHGSFYTSRFNDSLKFTQIRFLPSSGFAVEVSQAATIKFITAQGTMYESASAETSATYVPTSGDVYVRCEVTDGTNTLWSNAVIL